MTEAQRVAMLEPPKGKVSVVIDTDPHRECDDHFALAYAIAAAEKGEITIRGLHADFSGNGSIEEGMQKNYDAILNIIDCMHCPQYKDVAFHGATRMFDKENPEMNDAVKNLIRVANDPNREEPLYVIAIGGSTNIATALAAAPEIAEKMVLILVGGNSLHWNSTMECNFWRDPAATEHIFDCGVPLVMIPACNVTIQLTTTVFELEHYIKERVIEKEEICEFLLKRFGGSKKSVNSCVIFDIGGIGYVLHPEFYTTRLITTPVFQYYWGTDPTRPLMRICDYINRDALYMDMFNKLTK